MLNAHQVFAINSGRTALRVALQPRYPLPLRPLWSRGPTRSCACVPAPHLPYAHRFIRCRFRPKHYQLAAGPVRQLPGAAGVPGETHPSSRSRWIWLPRWRCTTRSTSSWSRGEKFRSTIRAAKANWLRIWRAVPMTPLVERLPGPHRQAKPGATIDFGGAEPACLPAGHALPDPPGAGRADPGETLVTGPPAPAAIPPGCWCSCCVISGWQRFVSGY